jgi:hypothetical protein
VNKPDAPLPTLAEFREILITKHNCFTELPPKNNYSRRQLNIIKREADDGTIYECPAFPMNDDEHVTKDFAIWVCLQLGIYPAKIPFLSHIAIL